MTGAQDLDKFVLADADAPEHVLDLFVRYHSVGDVRVPVADTHRRSAGSLEPNSCVIRTLTCTI